MPLSLLEQVIAVKIAGSAIGSSIAVVFKKGKGDNPPLLERWVIGMILGFSASPFLLDWLGASHTLDYWFASTIWCGSCSYLTLQTIFNYKASDIIKEKIDDL